MGGKQRFRAIVRQDDKTTGTGIELPWDPKEVFGKARAPVRVTVNEHTFRTTTFTMHGQTFVPLNKQNRETAGVRANQRIDVTMELDTEPRVITPPPDFAAALRELGATERWEKLSYTHQREHVEAIEEAKKPETRARRIRKAIEML